MVNIPGVSNGGEHVGQVGNRDGEDPGDDPGADDSINEPKDNSETVAVNDVDNDKVEEVDDTTPTGETQANTQDLTDNASLGPYSLWGGRLPNYNLRYLEDEFDVGT